MYARKIDFQKEEIIKSGNEMGVGNNEKQILRGEKSWGASVLRRLQFKRLPTKHCRKPTAKKIHFRK